MANTKKITFQIPAFQSASLIDLGASYLEMNVKIVDEKGKLPDPSVYTVGMVNNVLHSLFSDVKLIINGKF